MLFPQTPVPVLHGRVQEPGPRHRGLSQTLEEVCWVWMSRKRDISPGMEEQKLSSEAVHDAGPEAGPHDVRCQVRGGVRALWFVEGPVRLGERVKVKHLNLWAYRWQGPVLTAATVCVCVSVCREKWCNSKNPNHSPQPAVQGRHHSKCRPIFTWN